MMKKLSRSDLGVGRALPWTVYNRNGELLLRAGYRISSEGQIAKLLELGLYRDPERESGRRPRASPTPVESLFG